MKKLDLGDGEFIIISDASYYIIKQNAGREKHGYLEFNQYSPSCDMPSNLHLFSFDIDEFEDYE